MGLFDANLRAVRRLFEEAWRELAGMAGTDGYLTAPRARLEIRMRLWVYPDKGRCTAEKSWESKAVFDLDSESPIAQRLPRAKSAWEQLMED